MVARREDRLVKEVMTEMANAFALTRKRELVEIAILVAIFVVGLALLIFGAVTHAWQLLIPGGLVQAAIAVPIQRLMKLRAEKQTLLLLPQLMRLADSEEAKRLAAMLILKLIGRL